MKKNDILKLGRIKFKVKDYRTDKESATIDQLTPETINDFDLCSDETLEVEHDFLPFDG